MENGQHMGPSQHNQEQDLQQQRDNEPSLKCSGSKALSYQRKTHKRSDNDPQPSSSFQVTSKQQSTDYDKVNDRLEEFVRYFVKEFEAKLHAYLLILEGEIKKAGKFSDAFSENVGQGIGAAAGGLVGFVLGLPGIGAKLGATAGKVGGGKLGSKIGCDQHKKKATNLVDFVGLFQKDKTNFRRVLVEAGFDIFQSFEMQFMRITTDQGPKIAMQLLAKDATNRAIDYLQKERTFITEGVILGKSKIEPVWGVPIPHSTMKTSGFDVDYEYMSSKEKWPTASLYEKVGLVRPGNSSIIKAEYYEKKDGKSRTDKYGYRRLFISESWDKLEDKYRLSSNIGKSIQFTDYQYILNSKDSERRTKDILKKVNLDDRDLAEERITKIIEEAKSDIIEQINLLKKKSHSYNEDRKTLISIETNLKNLKIDEYVERLKQNFEEVKQGQQKIVTSIEASRKENRENHDDDMREHKETQQGIERIEKEIEDNSKKINEIHEVVITQKSKQVNESVWFDVKEPVRLFTGRRQELSDLHTKIHSNSQKVTVISQMTSISGLGGIGKTELARKYIQEYSKYYDNNVMWMDAESEGTLMESFSRLAKDKLKIETKDADGREKNIKSIVEEVYKFFSKRKSIFILDNTENNEYLKKFLPLCSLPPDSNKPYILITSRDRDWKKQVEVIDVNELKLEDAVEFVKKGLGIKDESQDQGIKVLVEKLQRFPLAMQQAIAYIQDQRGTEEFSIDNYLEEYKEKTKVLLNSEVFNGIDNDYAKTTFTTWKITIDKIANNTEHGELALKVLNAIAYLPPEGFNREMLRKLAGDDKEKLSAAVLLLVKYSMVNGEEKQSVLSIHRLVQEVTRIELKGKGEEKGVLEEVLTLLKITMEKGGNPTGSIYTSYAWGYASKYEELIKKFSTLPSQIISGLKDAVRYEEAYLFGMETLSLLKDILGPDDPDTLSTMNGIADVLYKKGKYDEALDKYKEVLKERKEVLGEDHADTLSTMNGIADVLYKQGKYDEALDKYKEVLKERKEVLGGDHPDTLSTMNGLADVLYKQGKYVEALDKYKEVLKERKKGLGGDDPDTLSTMNGIADVLYKQGKYEKAFSKYEEVLGKRIQVLGEDHPDTLSTLRSIALVLMKTVDDIPSDFPIHLIPLYVKRKKNLGENHPDTLSTMHEVAANLYYHAKYDEALSKYEEVLGKRQQVLGEDHPSTLTTINGIAEVLKKQGKNEEAMKIFQEVYKKRKEKLGENHPDTLSTLHEIAAVLSYQGKYDEALSKYEEVLGNRIQFLGEDHPDTLTTINGIAEVLKKQGKNEEALKILQVVFGNGPVKSSTLHVIAAALSYQGKYDEALTKYEEVLGNRIQFLGEDHPDTLTTRNGIAKVLKKQGKIEESLKMFQGVYERRMKKLVENHPATLSTLHEIAAVLSYQGKYDEALSKYEEVLGKRKQILGEDHPCTLTTRNGIAEVLKKQGKIEESLKMFQEVYEKRKEKLGENHPATKRTKDSMDGLTQLLGSSGEH